MPPVKVPQMERGERDFASKKFASKKFVQQCNNPTRIQEEREFRKIVSVWLVGSCVEDHISISQQSENPRYF
jgi:hypothetical protein